jgi:hypothetical protein
MRWFYDDYDEILFNTHQNPEKNQMICTLQCRSNPALSSRLSFWQGQRGEANLFRGWLSFPF